MPNFSPDGKRLSIFSTHLAISQLLESWAVGLGLGLIVLIMLGSAVFLWIFDDRLYPGTSIDAIPMGGLTKKEAWTLLQQKTVQPSDTKLTLEVDDISISSSSAELGLHREYESAIDQAYLFGRSGNIIQRLSEVLRVVLFNQEFSTTIAPDADKAKNMIAELKQKVDVPGSYPRALLRSSREPSTLTIDPGFVGREIHLEETYQTLHSSINSGTYTITPEVASVGAQLTEEQVPVALEKAKRLVGERIILRASNTRVEVNDQHLISFLAFPDGINNEVLDAALDTWTETVNRPAENAVFDFDKETLVVKAFKPHREGLTLNREEASTLVTNTLSTLLSQEKVSKSIAGEYHDTQLDLPVSTVQPEITLEKMNELGITERIGFGESEYDHSIPNRVHNVSITSERINNVIVPAGAEFSFNKTVGEVSSLTGYKSAYVIKNGKTELGDGGGVCQVSTTLFRSVLNAGLEVTKRLPHSYRVSYYELNAKPGIDATVYAGDVDFRFKNDTNHAILIHSEADSENLYMKVELYGTSDGRTSEIVNHEVWDFRPAPPSEFYPDPSLRPGQRKQIDWAVGGVKAKFTNVVKDKDGAILREDTYYSNYRPWSAKYLVGV